MMMMMMKEKEGLEDKMGCDQTGDLDRDDDYDTDYDDQDDDNMMIPGDNNDDQDDDERGEGRVEDKMGCDQTGDLDGAFVPPLSDHPCLQCPALSSTNRTQPNHNVLEHFRPPLFTMSQHKLYRTKSYHIIPHMIKYPCLQCTLQTFPPHVAIQRSKADHIVG